MREQFEAIYRNGGWDGKGSGPGSDPKAAEPYLMLLKRVLAERKPKRVLDVGCGDWQLFRGFAWPCMYCGIDIVPSVIAENQKRYAAEHVSFHCADGTDGYFAGFGLVLVKDVFAHLPFAAITRTLSRIAKSGIPLLFCGDVPSPTRRGDIEPGGYRAVDPRSAPWNLKASETIIFESAPREKLACLFTEYAI